MTHADDAELRARITLVATPGLSQLAVLELISEHGSAVDALDALRRTRPAEAAAARTARVQERVDRTLRVVADENITVLCSGIDPYPRVLSLRLGRFAPPLLFARGDVALLDAPCIAIVGCRRATPYGLEVAEELAGSVARVRGCVVSGLALGIDGAAHRGALDADGMTTGVLGCGIDVYYPHEHAALQDRIAHDGLLLSELLPGQPPLRHHFPHRNRIIAALSSAVVVVEASEKSGAVKTAEHALQQGLEVYVVPNALDLPNMQGNLALLRDGAHVFTGSRDLLESTRLLGVGAAMPRAADREAPPEDPLHRRLWGELTHDARHVDAIASAAGLSATSVLVALLELELEGRVRQLPGGRFARVSRRPPRRVA